jgi:hypothetical protein
MRLTIELGCFCMIMRSQAMIRMPDKQERREQTIENRRPVESLNRANVKEVERHANSHRGDEHGVEAAAGGRLSSSPSRQAKVSAKAYAVDPASVGMARRSVPMTSAVKRIAAQSPAKGRNASAASREVSISVAPLLWSMSAVVRVMNTSRDWRRTCQWQHRACDPRFLGWSLRVYPRLFCAPLTLGGRRPWREPGPQARRCSPGVTEQYRALKREIPPAESEGGGKRCARQARKKVPRR